MQKAFEDYTNMLLEATRYSGGNQQTGESKTFSASMLGSPLLQNYYRVKYGSQEQTIPGANTLGSIYQLGVDQAALLWNSKNAQQYVNAMRLQYMLDNEWIVSGEIDQYDKLNNVIFDNKLVTDTIAKKIKQEGKWHPYALQLGVYKWLMMKNDYVKKEPACVLAIGNKTFSHYKKNNLNPVDFIELETHSLEDIEGLLYDKTNELDEYLNNDLVPQQPPINDLMPYKRKGQARVTRMRCEYYCDYKGVCKYYKTDDSINSFINKLL